jgi:hypothetical protein
MKPSANHQHSVRLVFEATSPVLLSIVSGIGTIRLERIRNGALTPTDDELAMLNCLATNYRAAITRVNAETLKARLVNRGG